MPPLLGRLAGLGIRILSGTCPGPPTPPLERCWESLSLAQSRCKNAPKRARTFPARARRLTRDSRARVDADDEGEPEFGMNALPVDALLPRIIETFARGRDLVIVAEPGAGKTTRVPAALLDAVGGDESILLLEPRRLATKAAAERLAQARSCALGEEVGYRIRFESRCSPKSRLIAMTEGVLTRRLQSDPFLEGVAAVVLDEFHERHLQGDLALALLKDLKEGGREDLRIVVMSATLDGERVAAYLGDAEVIHSPGRSFPLELLHRPARRSGPVGMLDAVFEALLEGTEREGDLLVFLPGVGEIEALRRRLSGDSRFAQDEILTLHGQQSLREQQRVFASGEHRRIILSTNVAESSLTIPGLAGVIDSGWVRRIRRDRRHAVDELRLERVSLASADQRAGRAARTAPGFAIRTWSPHEEQRFERHESPELLRVDLCGLVLETIAWGSGPRQLSWLDEAPEEELLEAEALLERLGALKGGRLTSLGQGMVGVPAHPRLAILLAWGRSLGIEEEAAWAATLCDEGLRPQSRRRSVAGACDLAVLVDDACSGRLDLEAKVLKSQRRSVDSLMRLKLPKLSAPRELELSPDEALRFALLAAFRDQVVKRRSPGAARGLMVGGRGVELSEESELRDPDLYVAVALDRGRRSDAASRLVTSAALIEPSWLDVVAPEAKSEREVAFYLSDEDRVLGKRQSLYFDLVLDERDIPVDPSLRIEVLADAARAHAETVLRNNDLLQRLLPRLDSMARWRPELAWPSLEPADLIEAAVPYAATCKRLRDYRALDWSSILLARLDRKQRGALDREAPSSWTLPGGRRVRLEYRGEDAPLLRAKVQHLFGVMESPRVGDGRPVLIELLAPNQRPVQRTDDLASFWRTTYQQVRKDLRGRYPKHSWPERPPGIE